MAMLPERAEEDRDKEPGDFSATRQRLLDAAERQFAEHGFDGASLRQISTEASVNLAATNYHFGGKEALYLAVFARRLRPINAQRHHLLDQLEAAAEPPTVAQLVGVIIEPLRALLIGESALTVYPFIRCLARAFFEPKPFMHEMMKAEFGPLFARLAKGFKRSLPHLAPEVISARLHSMVGAIFLTISRLVSGNSSAPLLREQPLRPEQALNAVVDFCVAGFSAPTNP
ncbi:MAG TPA: TetR family transcriptional regulator [Opitutaceae bacterium]|nr:TetR family transcriptional regulator [Opitutaceae bacterium]